MEHKYSYFVGYASIQAFLQLQTALEKWRVTITPEILEDAAKAGMQKALEKMFPGLVRPPFERKPLADIIMSLRYQYESDPEKVHAVLNGSPKAPAASPSGTGWRKADVIAAGPADTNWRVAPSARNSSENVRTTGVETSRYTMAPASTLPPPVSLSQPTSGDESSAKLAAVSPSPRPQTPLPADVEGPVSKTRLQRIGPPPIFPWEKKRSEQSGE